MPASSQQLAAQGNLGPYASIRIYRYLPSRPPARPRSFLWHASCLLARLSLGVVVACALLSLGSRLDLPAFRRVGAMLPDPVPDGDAIRTAASRARINFDTLAPTSGSMPRKTFGMGSSKETVLAAQGSPTNESGAIWRYGASEVYFVGDRVAGWRDSPSDPLKLR
jgi:hypothetical protein